MDFYMAEKENENNTYSLFYVQFSTSIFMIIKGHLNVIVRLL